MPTMFELIRGSWALYRRHFSLFGGYAAWLLLPYAASVLLSLLPGNQTILGYFDDLLLIAQLFLTIWLAVLIPLLAQAVMDGKRRLPIAALQETAWRRLPSVVWVSLIENAVFFGGLIFIVPAFIFTVWFGLSSMSAILDGEKGLHALVVTRERVRGKFWPVAWRLIGGPVLIMLIYLFVVNLVVAVVATVANVPNDILLSPTPPLWLDVIGSVGDIFILPVLMIYLTLLYLSLAPKGASGEKKEA